MTITPKIYDVGLRYSDGLRQWEMAVTVQGASSMRVAMREAEKWAWAETWQSRLSSDQWSSVKAMWAELVTKEEPKRIEAL